MTRRAVSLITVLAVLAASLCLALAPSAADSGKIIVPGRTVTTQEDLFIALGGEKTARIKEDGSIFLFDTIYLESPIVLSEGAFMLDGNADIVAEDFPAFILENGAAMSVGTIESPHNEDDKDVSIAFDGKGGTFGTPVIRIGEGCTLTTHYLFKIQNRVSSCDGCAIENAGTLVMYEGEISSCRSTGSGGAILNTGTAVLKGGRITGCSAENGGAIVNGGELTLAGTQIEKCVATSGGAVYNTGTATLTASVVTGCTAGSGGAFYNAGKLSLPGGTVEKCEAEVSGGGVFNASGAEAENTSSYFDSCSAVVSGGSVHNEGELKLSGGTLSGGAAERGGNVFNARGGRLETSGGQCILGKATLGGGIFNDGYLSVTSSGISTNKADHGTAVFNNGEFHISGFPYLDKKYDFFLVMNEEDEHPLIVDSEMKADIIARLTPGTFDGTNAAQTLDEGLTLLTGDFASQASGHYTVTQPEDGRNLIISEGVVVRVRSIWEGPTVYVVAALSYVLFIALIVFLVRLYDKKRAEKKELF